MKRIFIVFREFSSDCVNFQILQDMEVFTTYNRAVEYAKGIAEKSMSDNIKEETPECGWDSFAYRICWKTDVNTIIRLTVFGRNMNNQY